MIPIIIVRKPFPKERFGELDPFKSQFWFEPQSMVLQVYPLTARIHDKMILGYSG